MSISARIERIGRRLAFRPILAGASLRDRMIACLGGFIGIGLTALVGRVTMHGVDPHTSLMIAAPLGASAVMVFVVPASPMTQPWSIIGGHVVSALTGLVAAHLISEPTLAAGVAVGAAIATMSLCRCLHPSGGGTALLPVLGGGAVQTLGWSFALLPIGLNAVTLTVAAWVFHRLISGHSYPHKAASAAPDATIEDTDIDAALAGMGGPMDASRADLKTLAQRALDHARTRRR
ncbi:MAG: HPP family protein [Brevundimonas sp.]|nr:MAG: HPP family protein [Brevundimonas sp.]